MREDLLHFIWKHKKLPANKLKTTDNAEVNIVKIGQHNHEEGPDFFNAQVRIGEQLWVGNVEIHLKSSDWYAHNHEVDDNYNSVILHVVWEDDGSVFRNDNSSIPTLELKTYISKELILQCEALFTNTSVNFINCEKNINASDDFLVQNWLERLFFERLEQKTEIIKELLKKKNINFYTFKDQVIFEKDEVVKSDGDPYIVYTPYKNKWKEIFDASELKIQYTSSYLNNLIQTT